MLAILNSLNAHNFSIFEPILMILASKFMVHRVLSDTIYLSLELLPPLKTKLAGNQKFIYHPQLKKDAVGAYRSMCP